MNALYVEEFAANIFWALSNDPRPLTSEQRYALSWEAAMERFENAALITMDQRPHLQALDRYLASAIEMVRQRYAYSLLELHFTHCRIIILV
jgi:hypothetical protein